MSIAIKEISEASPYLVPETRHQYIELRALVERLQTSVAQKIPPDTGTAHSQDFLYDESQN